MSSLTPAQRCQSASCESWSCLEGISRSICKYIPLLYDVDALAHISPSFSPFRQSHFILSFYRCLSFPQLLFPCSKRRTLNSSSFPSSSSLIPHSSAGSCPVRAPLTLQDDSLQTMTEDMLVAFDVQLLCWPCEAKASPTHCLDTRVHILTCTHTHTKCLLCFEMPSERKKALMSTCFTLREFSPHEPLRSSLTFVKFRPVNWGDEAGDCQSTPYTWHPPMSQRHSENIYFYIVTTIQKNKNKEKQKFRHWND